MTQPLDRHAPAATFLTHYFGGGLVDKGECYVVERFRSMSSGEIRRSPGKRSARKNGCARPTPEVASVDEVRDPCHDRLELIGAHRPAHGASQPLPELIAGFRR